MSKLPSKKQLETQVNPFANPVHTRIAALDSIVVGHDVAKYILQGITECISWSEASLEPRGALLMGIGGTGKTTICNTILKRFPPRDIEEADMIVRHVPAFYASIPSPSTIKSVAANLLECLGDDYPLSGTAIGLTDRLCKLIKVSGTKIILLDEFHHLLANTSNGEARANQVCNWIKALVNETGVMVCLVGAPDCEALVDRDPQLSRRFAYRFRLAELGAGTKEVPGPLRKFLLALTKQYVERLNLDGFLDFNNHLAVAQVWAATSGNPAFVVLLLKEALAIALTANRNTVVLGDLFEAYQKGITLSVSNIAGNPFGMNMAALSKAFSAIKLN